MWYVNSELIVCYDNTLEESFILTMWYVNFDNWRMLLETYDSFILTMWYVNKEEWATIMEYYKSFILTMWYVNHHQV